MRILTFISMAVKHRVKLMLAKRRKIAVKRLLGGPAGPKVLVLYTRFQMIRQLKGARRTSQSRQSASSSATGVTGMIGRIVKIYQSAGGRVPITETRVR
jgi:hypothetical protein